MGFQTLANKEKGKLLPKSMRRPDMNDERYQPRLNTEAKVRAYMNKLDREDNTARRQKYEYETVRKEDASDERGERRRDIEELNRHPEKYNSWEAASYKTVAKSLDQDDRFNDKYYKDSYGRIRRR